LHSTVSANWPITIGLTSRKANVPRCDTFYREKPAEAKELEHNRGNADRGQVGDAYQGRALLFEAGPAPRM